jgi:hypothetical protein
MGPPRLSRPPVGSKRRRKVRHRGKRILSIGITGSKIVSTEIGYCLGPVGLNVGARYDVG